MTCSGVGRTLKLDTAVLAYALLPLQMVDASRTQDDHTMNNASRTLFLLHVGVEAGMHILGLAEEEREGELADAFLIKLFNIAQG